MWTISLVPFAGPDAMSNAQKELAAMDQIPGLEDAYIIQRGNRAVVCIGKQPSPSSKEALSLLERVRSIRVGGRQPFETAFYIPPQGGAASDLELRSAKRIYGPSARYSLQVGVYGRADRQTPSESEIREARQAAEQAVRELRSQGELAFYSHGTVMSMVTVGVFGDEDIRGGMSPRLRAVQERFPHNLLNGKGVSQRVLTTDGVQQMVLQESFLVEIPS